MSSLEWRTTGDKKETVQNVCNDLLAAEADSGAGEVLVWEEGEGGQLIV